jgi:hypothetical protein
VVGTRKLQLSSHHMPKDFPKVTHKSNTPVKDYGLGNTIQLDNLVKIEFCNSKNIYGFNG